MSNEQGSTGTAPKAEYMSMHMHIYRLHISLSCYEPFNIASMRKTKSIITSVLLT